MKPIILHLLCTFITLSYVKTSDIHKCDCEIYFFNATHRSELVLDVIKTDFGDFTKECNYIVVGVCDTVCRTQIKEMTHELDLEKIPERKDDPIRVSLGQFLCNKAGHRVANKRVGVWAHMHYKINKMENERPFDVEHDVDIFTGLESKQTMSCNQGVFISY